jgi:cytochrome c biogenesis protein CcmG/thiol:disulfide interchange protein DsbE
MSEAEPAGRGRNVQRVAQAVALIGVAALLALLVWKVVAGNGGGAADALARGEVVTAPPFTLERLDAAGAGKQLSLADLAGKPVVVNFWASWCIPCKDEAPVLQKTYEKYRSRGLVVLGIDAQDFRKDGRHFMKRFGVTYPVVYDGKGSTLGKWGVTGFPETFFVNRSGKLVGERIEGGVDIARNREAFARGIALALESD